MTSFRVCFEQTSYIFLHNNYVASNNFDIAKQASLNFLYKIPLSEILTTFTLKFPISYFHQNVRF